MLITKKMLLALVLIAALVGGGVGALITHSTAKAENEPTATTAPVPATTTDARLAAYQAEMTPEQIAAANASQLKTPEEQTAYRAGFEDGFGVCGTATQSNAMTYPTTYRAPVRRYSNGTRRVYYDYSQPRGRSFWQKHRDKLTLAIGTGAGAAVGGLIGGKKGAAIGALSGLGGSALYTYKLRKRSPRRY
jgi:hypothetical protein